MPPINDTDQIGIEDKAELIPREDYVDYWKRHPNLTPMPKEMREDLPPLPIDAQGLQIEEIKPEEPNDLASSEIIRKVAKQESMVRYISDNKSADFEQIDEDNSDVKPELEIFNIKDIPNNGLPKHANRPPDSL